MRLHAEEALQGEGRVESLGVLIPRLLQRRDPDEAGPFLLAIDGRSSSGKSTLAARTAAVTPATEVVHTDDMAWWHSRFGWDDLLLDHVVAPLRRGESVAYRPPAWEAHGRGGCIAVPHDTEVVVVEGVGAGRASIAERVDAVIWVQSDLAVTDRRTAERIEAGETDRARYEEWMSEEIPFQAEQRTWETADLVVCGSSDIRHDPDSEVVVLRP